MHAALKPKKNLLKRIIALVLVCVLLAAVFVLPKVLHKKYIIPVLMYHSVSYVKDPVMFRLIITPEAFDRQMRFLRTNNYNIVSLRGLYELLSKKRDIPPKTIAITFDDGYKDNYEYAYPILKKYQIPAAIFIIIDEVGRPQNDRLNWGQIKEMSASGLVTIGCHTFGPQPLINVKPEEELRRQIFDSKIALREKIARPVDFFSYPEGMYNPHIKELVKDAGYLMAVATNPGRKSANDDLFAIKRLRISQNSNNLFIFWVESSGFYTYVKEYHKDRKEKRNRRLGR